MMGTSPLTRLRIELLEAHAEECSLSPFPETARFNELNEDTLMSATYLCQLFGLPVPTDKEHVLLMLAFAITILEEEDGKL